MTRILTLTRPFPNRGRRPRPVRVRRGSGDRARGAGGQDARAEPPGGHRRGGEGCGGKDGQGQAAIIICNHCHLNELTLNIIDVIQVHPLTEQSSDFLETFHLSKRGSNSEVSMGSKFSFFCGFPRDNKFKYNMKHIYGQLRIGYKNVSKILTPFPIQCYKE